MPLACLFVDDIPVTADLLSITVVTLMGRHKLDPAVEVPVVVPVHKRRYPLACLFHTGEWATWVGRRVFRRAEQRFGVRVLRRLGLFCSSLVEQGDRTEADRVLEQVLEVMPDSSFPCSTWATNG